jgi:ADP-heptose:LPS heptosyltransferase
MEQRSKAFFLNGGAGRMISAIPAFEKYEQESGDQDFIIICEGGTDVFKGHPTLDARTYDVWHKNLFVEKLKDKDIVSTEPYRVWEYYNQKCSIAQAFDIEINKKGIRPLPKPTLILSKDELLTGRKLISDVKKQLKKSKIVVFQPFGRGIQVVDDSLVDSTSRSIEFKDVKAIIKRLQEKDFGVILMSEFKIDFTDEKFKDEIAMPENVSMRQWAAIIKYCDHFLGCDSLGQHLAHCLDKPATVLFGSTYPINVSYPENKLFTILDMGEDTREYSPIRITQDERVDRKHETIMTMTSDIQAYIVDAVQGKNKK